MNNGDYAHPAEIRDDTFFEPLERRRTAALVSRDMDVVERLHAQDYQLITPAGAILCREEYLSKIASAPFYTAWECGPMSMRRSQDMAVVRYRARIRFPSGRVVNCWHTDTYERGAQGWQAVWSQATEIHAL